LANRVGSSLACLLSFLLGFLLFGKSRGTSRFCFGLGLLGISFCLLRCLAVSLCLCTALRVFF